MKLRASKTGNGAFDLRVEDDGTTFVGGARYATAQDAYDHFREAHERTMDHSAWNICYLLEDVLDGAIQ